MTFSTIPNSLDLRFPGLNACTFIRGNLLAVEIQLYNCVLYLLYVIAECYPMVSCVSGFII